MEKNYRAELTGVFGDPVDGNPTGVMEEAAYRECGLNYRYLTLRVKKGDLAAALSGARAVGMKGFNLTMPHKIDVIPYLDRLTPAAALIGAVNTVVEEDGSFVRSLEMEGISLKGACVTLLGAGGAARAIGVECALAGAEKLIVINRSRERGEELAELISRETPAKAEFCLWTPSVKIPPETQILVQATCVGLHPHGDQKPDIDYETITDRMTACDVVFHPVFPLFLQEARRRGAGTVTGIGMLVQQGALNFELWTGREAPVETMYRTLEAEFGASQQPEKAL